MRLMWCLVGLLLHEDSGKAPFPAVEPTGLLALGKLRTLGLPHGVVVKLTLSGELQNTHKLPGEVKSFIAGIRKKSCPVSLNSYTFRIKG